MESLLISIIVPIYNVENYLRQCIQSIIDQTYKNIEIILIDDGSNDSCPEICDSYLTIDRRIVVIHKTNGGLSDARNAGIDISRGDFIVFVDSDDYIDSTFLSTLYKLSITNNSEITSCNFYTEKKKNTNKIIRKFHTTEAFSLMLKDKIIAPSACAKLFKRNLFEKLRFPIGKLFEDFYVAPILFSNASLITHTSEELYYYRKNPTSIMNSRFNLKYLDIINAHEEIETYIKTHDNNKHQLRLLRARKARFCISFLTKYVLSNSVENTSKEKLIKEIKSNYFHFLFIGFRLNEKLLGLFYIINYNLTVRIVKLLKSY